MNCRERMEAYLRENGVAFAADTHAQAFTMQEVAAALHVPGCQVAKVVMVKTDDKKVMAVLPAPYRLNIDLLRELVGAKKARLAKEEEFADLFPDCATGAMPPFGNLYDVPVYVDRSMGEEEDMIFRVGTHRETFKIAYADFVRVVQPVMGDFAWQI